KSEEQQATLTLHRTRELLVRQRTMCVNALRGHLTEFGLVAAKGIGRAGELIDMAGNDAALPEIAKSVVKIFAGQLAAIQASIAALEQEIAGVHAQSPMSQLACWPAPPRQAAPATFRRGHKADGHRPALRRRR